MRAIVFTLLAMIAIGFVGLRLLQTSGEENGEALIVYCAAGMKRPVEKIARQFQEEYGQEVTIQYGGTGTLVAQVELFGQGDLLIAADSQAIDILQTRGDTREVVSLAKQFPVVCVPAGNPKNIQTLADLYRTDLKIAIGNPEASSIGKATRQALKDRWDIFLPHVTVMKPTVTEIAMDVVIGSVDAAIVWNSTVPQFDTLTSIRLPEFDPILEPVSAAILASTKQPDVARDFARYLAAPEKGSRILTELEFIAIPGEPWSGAPARPPIPSGETLR